MRPGLAAGDCQVRETLLKPSTEGRLMAPVEVVCPAGLPLRALCARPPPRLTTLLLLFCR